MTDYELLHKLLSHYKLSYHDGITGRQVTEDEVENFIRRIKAFIYTVCVTSESKADAKKIYAQAESVQPEHHRFRWIP